MNAYLPILVTLSGIVTLVNNEQYSNALSPINLQLELIETVALDIEVVPAKYMYLLLLFPKYFKLPSVLYCKLLQPLNANSPMLVTLSGISTSASDLQ